MLTTQRGLRIYSFNDTNEILENPLKFEAEIYPHDISWTITDADISSHNKFLVHSTLNPILHFFDLEKMKYTKSFNLSPEIISPHSFYYSLCHVFSIKISGDNNELIAGCGKNTSGKNMKIFNIEKNVVTNNIAAHQKDINSICYLDRESSAIFLSASDDGLGKVWDLRALGMHQNCSGYLIGHNSGLTSISSRGDQIHCATNSKDQSLKLWDLRKLADDCKNKKAIFIEYDYRIPNLQRSTLNSFRSIKPESSYDNSLRTFHGHKVLLTLIRCHFSPENLTSSRYIYSGSSCGRVFIWDILTGKNVAQYLPRRNKSIARDCTWHPNQPFILSTNLDGMIYKLEYESEVEYVPLKASGEEDEKPSEILSDEDLDNYDEGDDDYY